MDPQPGFPNELWLEIFSHLPPDALINLSSTDRALYAIARPLGFTEFRLKPYPYDYNPPPALLDAALQRLNFWSSPQVAPHVRLCTARHYTVGWDGSQVMNDDKAPHVLMNAFFENLPKFTGLQQLYTERTEFTQLGVTNLCALPALTLLDISASKVAHGERINPASLTLHVSTFLGRMDWDHMNDLWISLLSRDSIRELNIDPMALAKPEVQPFPNVHTLTVENSYIRTSDILAISTKFPALRVFVFASDYHAQDAVMRNTPSQTSAIFPILEEYTGMYENLHIFVQRRTLTHITLVAEFPFRKLVTELQGVAELPNITSLTAGFNTLSSENLFGEAEIHALFALFPRLTVLDLKLYPDVDEDGGFAPQVRISSISSSRPPQLFR
jgi:hypothetical protein